MRSIEYRRWDPLASPLCVEFPAELLLDLGWAEAAGILYGSRRGREVRVTALETRVDEEQEKIGVFVSRIRGEVFLTEADLALLKQQNADLALVVAGKRAGFFVRESDGSIQTVRSHEEFLVPQSNSTAAVAPVSAPPRPAPGKARKCVPARWVQKSAVVVAGLLLVAAAVFPQHPFPQRGAPPSSIDLYETDRQLRISWKPAQNAVLTIDDSGGHISIPVYADQTNVTYARRGPEVEVSLSSVDASNRLSRVSARFEDTKPGP